MLVVVATSISGCGKRTPSVIDQEYLPPHTLAGIITELKLYESADCYRLPYPRTPAGQNVFKATVKRLDNFQELYPDKNTDIVLFSRALALVKLGEIRAAVDTYSALIQYFSDSPLVDETKRRLRRLEKILDVMDTDIFPSTVEGSITMYNRQIYETAILIQETEESYYHSLLLLLRERLQVERALLLKVHYASLEEGVNRTLDAFRDLIAENKESKRIWEHRLMSADFYYSLAREYTASTPPDSLHFDREQFEAITGPARELYFHISRADGYHEKIEAEHKLKAINAFIKATLDKAQ